MFNFFFSHKNYTRHIWPIGKNMSVKNKIASNLTRKSVPEQNRGSAKCHPLCHWQTNNYSGTTEKQNNDWRDGNSQRKSSLIPKLVSVCMMTSMAYALQLPPKRNNHFNLERENCRQDENSFNCPIFVYLTRIIV